MVTVVEAKLESQRGGRNESIPLCVVIVCVTAIIITMIICKVSLETIFSLIIGLLIIAFVVANLIDL